MAEFAERVADAVMAQYRALRPKGKPQAHEYTALAAFVLTRSPAPLAGQCRSHTSHLRLPLSAPPSHAHVAPPFSVRATCASNCSFRRHQVAAFAPPFRRWMYACIEQLLHARQGRARTQGEEGVRHTGLAAAGSDGAIGGGAVGGAVGGAGGGAGGGGGGGSRKKGKRASGGEGGAVLLNAEDNPFILVEGCGDAQSGARREQQGCESKAQERGVVAAAWRPGFHLHLYCSQLPCGDACIVDAAAPPPSRALASGPSSPDALASGHLEGSREEGADGECVDEVAESTEAGMPRPGPSRRLATGAKVLPPPPPLAPSLDHRSPAAPPDAAAHAALACGSGGARQREREGGGQQQVVGVVRRKPGRGEATLSVSCSDKMARWNVLGVQGEGGKEGRGKGGHTWGRGKGAREWQRVWEREDRRRGGDKQGRGYADEELKYPCGTSTCPTPWHVTSPSPPPPATRAPFFPAAGAMLSHLVCAPVYITSVILAAPPPPHSSPLSCPICSPQRLCPCLGAPKGGEGVDGGEAGKGEWASEAEGSCTGGVGREGSCNGHGWVGEGEEGGAGGAGGGESNSRAGQQRCSCVLSAVKRALYWRLPVMLWAPSPPSQLARQHDSLTAVACGFSLLWDAASAQQEALIGTCGRRQGTSTRGALSPSTRSSICRASLLARFKALLPFFPHHLSLTSLTYLHIK
ncbi:unnamed protein product, partial [Closterium sp. Naga37s-1]